MKVPRMLIKIIIYTSKIAAIFWEYCEKKSMVHRRESPNSILYLGNKSQRYKYLSHTLKLSITKASSISSAKQKIYNKLHDLVLIELEFFQKEIFDIIAFIRYESHFTIIIVLMTTVEPNVEKKLFYKSVDDVIVGKQASPATLISRIKRRLYNGRLLIPKTNRIMLKNGVLIDLDRREIYFNKSYYKLKGTTYKLFQYFLDNPNRAISREELVKSYIWENSVSLPNNVECGRAVDMAIAKLRRLIEITPSNPNIVMTIHGIGWVLAKDAIQ